MNSDNLVSVSNFRYSVEDTDVDTIVLTLFALRCSLLEDIKVY